MSRKVRLMVSIIVVAMALMMQTALAVVRSNSIDPDATLSVDGKQVVVSGPIACDQGERLLILTGVTQASSDAWGVGYMQLQCTGDVQQWSVQVLARGATTFEPGHAHACAIGITGLNGRITDTRQWCAANGISLE